MEPLNLVILIVLFFLTTVIGVVTAVAISLYANAERDLKASLEGETFAQNICFETEDAREGIRAFVEKRDPVFRGR